MLAPMAILVAASASLAWMLTPITTNAVDFSPASSAASAPADPPEYSAEAAEPQHGAVDAGQARPTPSAEAVRLAREYLWISRTMMAHGDEEPAESWPLHELSLRERDAATRTIFQDAAQAFCRGDFPTVYRYLDRIADEPTLEERGVSATVLDSEEGPVDQSYQVDPIDVVVARWRSGDYYAPSDYSAIADLDAWLERRERNGINALAAHCEHQGRLEQYRHSD